MTGNRPDAPAPPPGGQLPIYHDGATRLQVRLDGQSVWLTQRQIAELYQVTVPNISQHIRSVYEEGDLSPEATVKQYLIVQTEGRREVSRTFEHYSLDVILAVGYRVRSARGTTFRHWATAQLAELLAKGFTVDDERIKAGRTLGADYFDELIERIRSMECVYLKEARYAGGFRVFLKFNDGKAGIADLKDAVFRHPAATPLRTPEAFARFRLDSWPTLAWDCEFDIAPETLYEKCGQGDSLDG